MERADYGREAEWNARRQREIEAEGSQVDLLLHGSHAGSDLGQECCQRANPGGLGFAIGLLTHQQTEVGFQAAVDCVLECHRYGIGVNLAPWHTALKLAR